MLGFGEVAVTDVTHDVITSHWKITIVWTFRWTLHRAGIKPDLPTKRCHTSEFQTKLFIEQLTKIIYFHEWSIYIVPFGSQSLRSRGEQAQPLTATGLEFYILDSTFVLPLKGSIYSILYLTWESTLPFLRFRGSLSPSFSFGIRGLSYVALLGQAVSTLPQPQNLGSSLPSLPHQQSLESIPSSISGLEID